ncbi:MAG: orotidine 5'-phosphate decarboxylase / HUMPS family protein [Candidatus Binatus sp.]|uniref:orotidine 5'-phosphate decarboxylase / HUMPS family protein n=1 Tax=Candidatus Binatus sp. TaxID=2811406 RepID=UPI002719A96B|nr:orotidine 5'-phosphate decarboxylase / HUMPS family protein [Candidatus Binatus sp.]MDO8430986.1 orotidine 5'-phosphate decarboxylase / HUMPS family protein [Candidatus Binatus sp.]
MPGRGAQASERARGRDACVAGLSPNQPRLIGPQGRHTVCADRVAEIARLAADASLDGVVTSPHQISRVRGIGGRRFVIVTSGLSLRPGVDGQSHGIDGPSHVSGAVDAIRAGADYVVVGAPVWQAPEPVRAVREITDGIERGLRANPRGALEMLNLRPL